METRNEILTKFKKIVKMYNAEHSRKLDVYDVYETLSPEDYPGGMEVCITERNTDEYLKVFLTEDKVDVMSTDGGWLARDFEPYADRYFSIDALVSLRDVEDMSKIYTWKQLMAMGIKQDEIRYALGLDATYKLRKIAIKEAYMPFIKAKINAYRCIEKAYQADYERRQAEWEKEREKKQQEEALQVATDAKNKAELKANPDKYIDRKGLRAKGYTESQILSMTPAFDLPYQYGQGNRKYWYVLEHSN